MRERRVIRILHATDLKLNQRNYYCDYYHIKQVKSKLNKKFWEELIVHFPWYDTDRIENDASNISSIITCLRFAALMFLPSRCLVTAGDKPTDTKTDRRHLWSRPLRGAQVYDIHTEFHKDWFSHSESVKGDAQAQTAWWPHKPTFLYNESRLKMNLNKLYLMSCIDIQPIDIPKLMVFRSHLA
jgi:hypothetical protein